MPGSGLQPVKTPLPFRGENPFHSGEWEGTRASPPFEGPSAMQLHRLQEKLPEAIINWYVKAGLQAKIKSVSARREGLTLVVKFDKAIHTWRYDECEPLAEGGTRPLEDWELEVLTKRGAFTQGAACQPPGAVFDSPEA